MIQNTKNERIIQHLFQQNLNSNISSLSFINKKFTTKPNMSIKPLRARVPLRDCVGLKSINYSTILSNCAE